MDFRLDDSEIVFELSDGAIDFRLDGGVIKFYLKPLISDEEETGGVFDDTFDNTFG